MPRFFKFFLVLFLAALLLRSPDQALADSAGQVIAARRDAWADRMRERAALLSKSQVFTGDLLITNQVGRLQVLFHDDTVLLMAPDSETRVTEFLYTQNKGSVIGMDLARGVTRIISGKVTDDGGMINLVTPEARIGIRGTDVISDNSKPGVTRLGILQGAQTTQVTSVATSETVEVEGGSGVIVDENGIRKMTRGEFATYVRTHELFHTGVNPPTGPVAGRPGSGPALTPGLVEALPGGPGKNPEVAMLGPALPQNEPDLPPNSGNQGPVTAHYAGTLALTAPSSGWFYSGTGTMSFTVKDLVDNPSLSNLQLNATAPNMDGGTYVFSVSAPGDNIATVTGGIFQVDSISTTGTVIGSGSPPGTLESDVQGYLPGLNVENPGGKLTWDIRDKYDPGGPGDGGRFEGTPVRTN